MLDFCLFPQVSFYEFKKMDKNRHLRSWKHLIKGEKLKLDRYARN